MSDYGTVAIAGDPWINERAQRILNDGLPPLPPEVGVIDEATRQADNADQPEE